MKKKNYTSSNYVFKQLLQRILTSTGPRLHHTSYGPVCFSPLSHLFIAVLHSLTLVCGAHKQELNTLKLELNGYGRRPIAALIKLIFPIVYPFQENIIGYFSGPAKVRAPKNDNAFPIHNSVLCNKLFFKIINTVLVFCFLHLYENMLTATYSW